MSHYSRLIAEVYSDNHHWVDLVFNAAPMHDIGKIGVSEIILNKEGALTEEEFESIKQHPCIGEKLCSPLKSLNPIWQILQHHHERYDGKGYPDGINGEDIPAEARVIAIADSFDAMSSDRPYRDKLSMDNVIRELDAGKDSQWDEKAVTCLIQLINDGIY
mgnify:CR=1 FL=1